MARIRRMFSIDEGETESPGIGNGALIDADLTPTARQAERILGLSLTQAPGRRAVAVFLGKDDYDKVEYIVDELAGALMLECLGAFVRAGGGQVVKALRFGNGGEVVNAVQRSVAVGGVTRSHLVEGYLFVHGPDQRVCVSAELIPVQYRNKYQITLRADRDCAGFWRGWQEFTHRNNYLRGQAFFADGEIIERKRSYSWDDILLPEATKALIGTHVEGFLRNRARLKALGVKARRGLILSGPPGTGKTLLGKVLADTLEASFLWVAPRHVQHPLSFQEIMSVARLVRPVVLFLEDLDLFAEERGHGDGAALGELMNQLDGAIDNEDIVTIATTNRLDVIEKALRNRPGRFDRLIEMGPLDEPCRRKMLQKLMAHAVLSPIDLAHLIAATADYTGAQLEELANTLYILAAERLQAYNTPMDTSPASPSPEVIGVDRLLIETALAEMKFEHKGRLGFHAA
ncbi:MAG: ATP-binding protein [Planctomycetota bacterium]|nr:ATP-binding protein [Planctomycetota bacterium]